MMKRLKLLLHSFSLIFYFIIFQFPITLAAWHFQRLVCAVLWVSSSHCCKTLD